MMLKALIFSLFVLTQQANISMTSIDYVRGTDSLKVSCRMYFDDFLDDLQTIDDDRNLRTIFSQQPFPDDLMNMYFNSKVLIYVNKKLLIGKLTSADLMDDEIILNLIYKTDKKPKRITVRNTILTGWHGDQTNLIIIRVNDFEKGIKLTPEDIEETFIIK